MASRVFLFGLGRAGAKADREYRKQHQAGCDPPGGSSHLETMVIARAEGAYSRLIITCLISV
jgi:hypothetical protein